MDFKQYHSRPECNEMVKAGKEGPKIIEVVHNLKHPKSRLQGQLLTGSNKSPLGDNRRLISASSDSRGSRVHENAARNNVAPDDSIPNNGEILGMKADEPL